jgi:hypothetical protein
LIFGIFAWKFSMVIASPIFSAILSLLWNISAARNIIYSCFVAGTPKWKLPRGLQTKQTRSHSSQPYLLGKL